MIIGGIPKRDAICNLLEDISVLFNSECMISVTDTERFIAHCPGKKVDTKVRIGDPVPPSSPLTMACQSKKTVTKVIPKEFCGVSFRSTATPIFDKEANVVGCVGVGISMERESKLVETYEQFSKLLNVITEQTDTIDGGMVRIAEDNEKIMDVMSHTKTASQEILELLGEIQIIASTTDILAVNASIEAARTGVQGKGFAVIATEIKELSQHTKKAVNLVSSLLRKMTRGVDDLSEITLENSELLQSQIQIISDINHVIDDMQATADNYSKLLN